MLLLPSLAFMNIDPLTSLTAQCSELMKYYHHLKISTDRFHYFQNLLYNRPYA